MMENILFNTRSNSIHRIDVHFNISEKFKQIKKNK